jgi:nicotinate-nucleotide adenylyltransferase
MKRGEPLTEKDHRKAMVELAIAKNSWLRLSTAELDRPGDTYTVDTLEQLRANEFKDDEIMFIMGIDTFNGVHRWKNPARILELARLVIALRPGYGAIDLTPLEAIVPTAGERVIPVEMPLLEISGIELRRRAGANEPIEYLVPDSVRTYIENNGLYR